MGPNIVRIDLPALVHNLGQIRDLVGLGRKIMGVVKADAYGHGLLPVSRTLEKSGVDSLGVAFLHEGLKLRAEGIGAPIVILCGIRTREECRAAVEKGLTPVLFDLSVAQTLAEESARADKQTPIHLKVDTGMGRLGISSEELGSFIERVKTFKNLRLEALISHLSSADKRVSAFTKTQARAFQEMVETGAAQEPCLCLNNLANSAGIMGHPETFFDMVRPGIMLYGGRPSPELISPVPLRPVMHFKGQVLQTRTLPANTPVSYGRIYYTRCPQRIAVLSAGYGDGLARSMSNLGYVLIRGRKTPIIGTICMNLTICDITGCGDVTPGDEAVFLGTQGTETIEGDDIARWAGTVSYEVFCSIGQRNKREYVT